MRISGKLLFLYASLALLTINASAEPLEKIADKMGAGLKDYPGIKIAVLNFPYHNGGVSSGSSLIQERLTTYLVQNKKLQVMERGLLNKLLEENKLEMSGLFDERTAIQLGKLLGVRAVVTGTLNDLNNNRTEINARVVETSTGKILTARLTVIKRTWNDPPVLPTKLEPQRGTLTELQPVVSEPSKTIAARAEAEARPQQPRMNQLDNRQGNRANCTGSPPSCDWWDAKAYCGGHLPSVAELKNLFNNECAGRKGAQCYNWFWSSEETSEFNARSVAFDSGLVLENDKGNARFHKVRCR